MLLCTTNFTGNEREIKLYEDTYHFSGIHKDRKLTNDRKYNSSTQLNL